MSAPRAPLGEIARVWRLVVERKGWMDAHAFEDANAVVLTLVAAGAVGAVIARGRPLP